MGKQKKLNLGCGLEIKEGWVNADIYQHEKSVVYCDMNKRFPWKKNTFDFVYMRHSLEHAKDTQKTIAEIWRVCKPKAIIKIIVPHYAMMLALTNLTHYQAFGSGTFNNYQPGSKRKYYYDVAFNIKEEYFSFVHFPKITWFATNWANRHKRFWELRLAHFFPPQEIIYVLEVVK
jgi:predicted SAM-dependent methyltransferase